MQKISEAEFKRISEGIYDDRDSIIKHNPIGPDGEVLLWMLLSCLISYLSLSELETPCFASKPDAAAYADAIRFVLQSRKAEIFDEEIYLSRLRNVEAAD